MYTRHVSSEACSVRHIVQREEQVTSPAKTSGGAGFGALVGEELSITDTIETVVTGSVRANNGVLSPVMEKRMINLLIIVLRAVVAVANALIAVLELIRELID